MATRILVLLIVCTLALPFTACQSKMLQNNEPKNKISIANPSWGGALCNQGIVYTQDGLVHFADISNGKTTVLCSKPNCKHLAYSINNPEPYCNAAISGNNLVISVLHGDALYHFVSDLKNTAIYQSDIDGSNRVLLLEVPYYIVPYSWLWMIDDVAYCVAEVHKRDETGFTEIVNNILLSIDLKEKSYCQLSEEKNVFHEELLFFFVQGDSLVYQTCYYEEEYRQYEDNFLPIIQKFPEGSVTEIWEIDLISGVEQKICTFDDSYYVQLCGIYENDYILADYKNNCIQLYDTETGETTAACYCNEDDVLTYAVVYRDNIIYAVNHKNTGEIQHYSYGIIDKSQTEFIRMRHESKPMIICDDYLIIFGENMFRCMTVEEYCSGGEDDLVSYLEVIHQ